ncbi:MbeD/MobD family mobilization/exclusion protein [Salmonella enterica]|nr:MbeD/MobD family mobilization/exclusion protein [Salmonella enterica]
MNLSRQVQSLSEQLSRLSGG